MRDNQSLPNGVDKISAPLMIVAQGPLILLAMWEPYSGLRYLQKPVDLIMLNTDEHALTNPAVRVNSTCAGASCGNFKPTKMCEMKAADMSRGVASG